MTSFKIYSEAFPEDGAPLRTMGANWLLKIKNNWQPTGVVGKTLKGLATGDAGEGENVRKIAYTIWEILDPTGLTSWDDCAEAFLRWKNNPSTYNEWIYYFSIIAALPSLGFGIPIKIGVKNLLKRAAKNPREIEEIAKVIIPKIKKIPGVPEVAKKFTTELGGTPADVEKVRKTFGDGTGVVISGPAKPKFIKPEEYRKLSGEAKKEAEKIFIKHAADEGVELAGKLTKSPTFNTMLSKQIWYIGEKFANLTDLEKQEKALQFIVKNYDSDVEVLRFMETLTRELGVPSIKIIEAIKTAYPKVKFPEIPVVTSLKGLEELGEIGAKKADDIVKVSDNPTMAAAKKHAEITATIPKIETGRLASEILPLASKISKMILTGIVIKAQAVAEIGLRTYINAVDPHVRNLIFNGIEAAVARGTLEPGVGGINPSKPWGIEPYKPGTKGQRKNDPAYQRNVSDGDDKEEN